VSLCRVVAFAALGAALVWGGARAASRSPVQVSTITPAPLAAGDRLGRLVPKAMLGVVRGEKTTAPAVPAPVTRSDNKIVEYDLTVRETAAQIAPKLTYQSLWTFDGTAPGPVLRVKVGDVIRLTLRNDAKSVTNHNVDLHFVTGACGGCADTTIKPGEARTIEARALYPGVFMYHCAYGQQGNLPVVHIANGMYGFLIVDPEVPLPRVDHEYMLIESEFYVEKDNNTSGVCSYDGLTSETPTYVFFNGKHADLTPPLKVRTNDRVRLYVGRGGVNGWSAFHVIGAIFDKVYTDGGTMDPPREHGIQTVNIPVGGASIVEFICPVPGKLTAVDHNLSRVYFKGLAQVIEVEGPPNPEIYEPLGESAAAAACASCPAPGAAPAAATQPAAAAR
jgi:nitrite reductase (NO-forming)